MCNLYDIGTGRQANSSRWAEIVRSVIKDVVKTLNIRRTDPGLVLRYDQDGQPIAEQMRWGIDMGHRSPTNNSRADRLKTVWKEAFEHRRCVIPMSAFYEWSGQRTYAVQNANTDDIMWAAGLWQVTSEAGNGYSMITTAAAPWFADVHSRMPALIAEPDIPEYLHGEGDPPYDMIQPWDSALEIMHCENPLTLKEPSPPVPVSQMDLFG